MAFKFKLNDSLESGVRRIAVEQLDKVLAASSAGNERAVWVHETRKALKRTRALLRMVRSGLDADTWDAENKALRNAARLLSPLRDRDILHSVMSRLAEDAGKPLSSALARFGERVAADAAAGSGKVEATELLDEAVAALQAARERLSELQLAGDLADVLAEGMQACQRRGSRALALVQDHATDTSLHELRKAVQTYWRQTALVEAAWPDVMGARVRSARGLAQILGDLQDLAVLAAAAEAADDEVLGSRDRARIVRACRHRQVGLEAVAVASATRIFALPGKSAGVELSRCWPVAAALAAVLPGKPHAPALKPLAASSNHGLRRRRSPPKPGGSDR